MNTGLKVILLLMLTLGLIVTGCSTGSGQGAQIGKQAPDFRLDGLDGQPVSLSDLRGSGVLIKFWASYCNPCRGEMPYIQEIYEAWSDKGLVVLTINIGESPSQVEKFMESQQLSLPVLLDTKQATAREYNMRGIPTTFFIDKDGIIQEKIIGAFQSKTQIEKRLSKIIP